MSFEEDLRAKPIRAYPCKGCALLKRASDDEHYAYRCTFWDGFQLPMATLWKPTELHPTNKQVLGPHTDESPHTCAQFVEADSVPKGGAK